MCLFGLHHIDAFPVDTWIEKILMEQYFDRKKYRRIPKNRLCETIVEDVFGRYSGCAGIMQQYIFITSAASGREGNELCHSISRPIDGRRRPTTVTARMQSI